ncbi:nuclear transport factor 2 family protein [Deinococcus cellulosilyticus]|uniref:SnoaL-like domain-containing protein n=1 Tax=Deinococcus cellulosilyticus (strain DSM 18568 / NBRC 106333 / KACC 11606 / 5516J-15) TaxID=1223518 RepID=A0A511MXV3_DEIC1|nr:nuclear transport factor 2 family protein [Deinococcus cellulosilyticus]GEM45393.1 hypothetical protein DC3_10280 [Deinococcus cellulosilyticus NBRC 106333 = KACC 11606]
MYHAIVRSIIRTAFRTLSQGKNADLNRILQLFSSKAMFSFSGDHALGGQRQGTTDIRKWFERFQRIFPAIHFKVDRILVSGWPWNTLVTTFFTVQAPLPDGWTYQNEGLQVLRICWGKITEDHLFEDTSRLQDALSCLEKHGLQEAGMPPL